MPRRAAQTAIDRAPRIGRKLPSSDKLADHHVLFHGTERAHGAQNGHGHGQIETGAFLADIGRGKVDGDGFGRIAEAGVEQRRFNALAAFFYRGVRHANGDEIALGASRIHIDLDVNDVRIDSLNGGAKSAKQSHTVLVGGRGFLSHCQYCHWAYLMTYKLMQRLVTACTRMQLPRDLVRTIQKL